MQSKIRLKEMRKGISLWKLIIILQHVGDVARVTKEMRNPWKIAAPFTPVLTVSSIAKAAVVR